MSLRRSEGDVELLPDASRDQLVLPLRDRRVDVVGRQDADLEVAGAEVGLVRGLTRVLAVDPHLRADGLPVERGAHGGLAVEVQEHPRDDGEHDERLEQTLEETEHLV